MKRGVLKKSVVDKLQTMTPEERREVWAQVLESGKYRQGIGQLRSVAVDRSHQFCCLGVACDLYSAVHAKSAWYGPNFEDASKEIESEYAPQDVRKWLGLDFNQAAKLAKLNDDGRGFSEIAGEIRALSVSTAKPEAQ